MAEAPLDPENPFWRFSCAVYAAPGVAMACLGLQDTREADVNLLLLAAWLGAVRGTQLEATDIAALPGAAWQAEVIRPLRGLRRRVTETSDIGDPTLAAFHRQLLDCELAAERIRQAELFRWCEARFPARTGVMGLARTSLGVLMGEGEDVVAALDLLASAAEAEAARPA
ncbi:TIGR02444 family protein [Plastoroseomonas hellenica]|uniref:TIGR02444 family protein n=1 Tax=Plastoroseomonas hellenica TaxID=2687306 RepID=UPI001BA484B1|nr:TIGR02444 family protein [Plastoroseomonas hellenica]MBR0642535.1 TIGR02444 family protein [Plastoroseomonas hellenica]